jgi:hypothetical protein
MPPSTVRKAKVKVNDRPKNQANSKIVASIFKASLPTRHAASGARRAGWRAADYLLMVVWDWLRAAT